MLIDALMSTHEEACNIEFESQSEKVCSSMKTLIASTPRIKASDYFNQRKIQSDIPSILKFLCD